MSKNKDYQHLLNSKRWKELRAQKLRANPLCERCLAEGHIRSAIDVHHITPVEQAKSKEEMEQLCYNIHNLQSLCIACHVKIHKDMRSHTRKAHQQRAAEALERWKRKNMP